MAKETGIGADPSQRMGAFLRRLIRHGRYVSVRFGLRRKEVTNDYHNLRESLVDTKGEPGHYRQAILAWSRWGVVWIGRLAMAVLVSVWKHIGGLADYYVSQRGRFGVYLTDHVDGLQEPKQRQREVCITRDSEFDGAEYKDGSWHVEMPARCFVCADEIDCPPERRFVRLEDVAGPAWCLTIGVVGGLLFSLIRWSWWPLVLGSVGGIVIGYQCRRWVDVFLQIRWCAEHSAKTPNPPMRVFGDQLIIRMRNKTVRQVFRQTDLDRASTVIGKFDQTLSTPDIAPIKLAESSGTPIEPQRTMPLAGSTSEEKDDPNAPNGSAEFL